MTTEDEEVLAELLLKWDELRQLGQNASALEMCQAHPHLVAELERRMSALKAADWMDRPAELQETHDGIAARHQPQTLVGRYRLEDLIAEGGFAQVWRAYDLDLHRHVAVKIPKSCRLDSTDAFMDEARRVARLKHPGIVPVHDLGREGRNVFIVSEFVEGGNLHDHLACRPLETDQATRWAIDIAEALSYAHAEGVIHRDIKPANILINHHGSAQLADFGIAQSADQASRFGPSIGTLRYMSPEQLEGQEADARSDIYSLGVVLLELLNGKLPNASFKQNVSRLELPNSMTVVRSSLPTELRLICHKALNVDPAQRYNSASELAKDLRKSLTRRSKGWVAYGVVGVILLLVVTGSTLWWPKSQSASDQIVRKAVRPIEDNWFVSVSRLPAKEQVDAVSAKLQERNKDFNGDLKSTIEDGVVVGLELLTDDVTDISPVRAIPGLKSLVCEGTFTDRSNGRLTDLSPLKGMALTKLWVNYNAGLVDLSPLKGMPLKSFHCGRTGVSDLSPLHGMPLTFLICSFNNVTDLSPLMGMQLTEFYCDHTRIADLGPLSGMPLEKVRCHDTLVSSLAPLQGAPLQALECHRSEVADLSPLEGMEQLYGLNVLSTKVTDFSPLRQLPGLRLLWCDFVESRDKAVLRSLRSLELINGNPTAAFWQELDNKPSELKPN